MKGLDKFEGLIPFDPSLSDLQGVLPIGLHPFKISKLDKPVTSESIIATVQRFGMSHSEIPLRLFRETKFGKPARKDNLDMITGYPFYGQGTDGVKNLIKMMEDISSFVEDFKTALKPHPELADMEMEDLKKITIQRRSMPGRHLQPPISLDFKQVVFPEDFKALLKRVVSHYVSSSTYLKTGKAAIYDGTDAKDTALGSPTFYVGEAYHAARVATCAAMPVPDYSMPPTTYIERLETMSSTIFPDPSLVYASYLSFRSGATNKAMPLFKPTGLGFIAQSTVESLYPRQRAVWAAPFYLNVLLTPLVLRMKSSRQHILGMWHDPQSEAKYIPLLQKQGKTSVEVDYSGYDTTIANELMYMVYSELAKQNYAPWESSLMAELTLRQGAITPSFYDTTESVSYFKGQVTLMSGLLPTSELGSIISRSIVLYCLSKQFPQIVEQAFSGKFVILIQSDDVLFTTNEKIDLDRFTADAAKLGITAKIKFGSTFLKRFLPLGPVPKLTKPFSRVIQQTIGNEDTYDGKPNAILRLGLAARMINLKHHPLFSKFWPRLFGIFEEHFEFVREIENKKDWLAGDPILTSGDIRAIQQYAETAGGSDTLTNILERAAFDPSAATVVEFLKSKGLDISFLEADQVTARKAYTDAFFSAPKTDSLQTLLSFARWNS